MTGRLELNFSYQGGPDVGALPVVVEMIDSNLEPAAAPRSVQLASEWKQDLEPGTYLARVSLPSGDVVRQTCAVRDGDRTRLAIDVRALPGHESLERPRVLRPIVRDESTPGLASPSFASVWAIRWRRVPGHRWQRIDFDGTAVSRDDHTVFYRFQLDEASHLLQLGGPKTRWRFVTLPARCRVDVTVSPRGEDDLAVEVTTPSSTAEALLGYLRTGAVEGADATAEALLRQKLDDPIAAAIGGYYLLRAARLDRLSDWAPNLSEWFSWLPDGAVINGWQHIHAGRKRRGDPDEHFDAARQQLLLAAKRGVPIYTDGLKLLVDGLRLLRKDVTVKDIDRETALNFVEAFAAAADWAAATVTYDGKDPAQPQGRPRYGVPKNRERLVLLQQTRLEDLIEMGLLFPGARLASSGHSGAPTATVTRSGDLDVVGIGTFQSPEATAKGVLGLDNAERAWDDWQVENAGPAAPLTHANLQRLGDHPPLNDLRRAARGEYSESERIATEMAASPAPAQSRDAQEMSEAQLAVTKRVLPMGPVSYLIVEFPGSKMTGEGFPALVDLVDRGLIRILDLVFVTRDVDGSIRALELRDIDRDGRLDLAVFEGASSGLLDDMDIGDAGSVLEPGSSAGILLFENRWAAPFTQALRNGGGELVAAGYIPADALASALEAAETSTRWSEAAKSWD
jgi:hypothetical protein